MENAICNMKCKYCFGGYIDGHNGHTGKVADFNPDILDKALRRVAPDYAGGIKFWGGEPLANYETLQKVVEYARAKFPYAHLILITNGSLLTKEKAKFFIKHKVSVNISHDGSGQSLRGKDFLIANSEQVEAIKLLKLNDCFGSFHIVLTSESCDLDKQIDYWTNVADNVIEFPVEVSWSIFRETDEWTKDFMPDINKHNEFLDYTFGQMADSVTDRLHRPKVRFMFSTDQDRALNYLLFGDKAEYPCATFESLTVGLSGKEYRCVQDCERRSVVDSETYAELMKKENFKLLPECDTCPVKNMCGGICAVLTDDQRRANCTNYINFYTYMKEYIEFDRHRTDLIAASMGASPIEPAPARPENVLTEKDVTIEECDCSATEDK